VDEDLTRRRAGGESPAVKFPATPADLDAAWLSNVLGRPVRGVSHAIIGVGFGLAGTSARLTLDGDGVPRTLVAKWAPTKDVRAEANFHDVLAPRLDLPLARLVAHASDDGADRGLLLFEDAGPARQGDVLVGATKPEAAALVGQMARLHAAFWARTDDPAVACLPAWPDDAAKRVRQAEEALPGFLAAFGGRVPPAALAFASDLPKRMEDAFAELGAAPQTLVHGDLHLDNVLFREDGTPVVLDWPSAKRGPAAADFGHFLVESLTPDARRAEGHALAERHVATLAARGVVGYGADDLLADARRVFVVLFGAAVRWASGPHASRPDVPRVALLSDSLLRRAAAAVVEEVA
jgi:phosphotransferase family enzyme